MRRRTYRAHGRINPYMSSPCHIEVVLSEKDQVVAKGEDDDAPKKEALQEEACPPKAFATRIICLANILRNNKTCIIHISLIEFTYFLIYFLLFNYCQPFSSKWFCIAISTRVI